MAAQTPMRQPVLIAIIAAVAVGVVAAAALGTTMVDNTEPAGIMADSPEPAGVMVETAEPSGVMEDGAEPDGIMADSAEQKPIVYATFFPYYEFAKGVAGDAAEVRQLLPRGAQMHDWEPDYQDIAGLSDAVAFVYSNPEVEPYTAKIQQSGDFDSVAFVPAAYMEKDAAMHEEHDEHGDEDAAMHEEHDEHGDEDAAMHEEHDEHDGHEDEHNHEVIVHTWLDPVAAIGEVHAIRNALIEADPANASIYEENAKEYALMLADLDEEFSEGLAECKTRTIITLHNAYDELGKRYDIEVFGLSLTHHAEASASEIATMIGLARERGVAAIFADDLSDARHERVAAEELGIEVLPLSTLEGLSKYDAEGTTYFEKMRANLESVREGLECR